MRAWLAVFLVACGSSSPPFPSDDIAFFDSGPDTTLPKDGGGGDVQDEPDSTPFVGGGPFSCIDCTCDGTQRLCEHFSGGPAPAPLAGDAGDASVCDPDAGQGYCAAIPIDCLPKPTCACVLQHFQPVCTCDVDPSGNGLVVSCNFP
jgi:hypothetical protein